MINQPLRNKKGGTNSVIDYICNERLKNGTARVLKGNPLLTKEIVKMILNKQKLLVGVLSFAESNLDEYKKIKIMDSFEKVLLPSMQGRYNILWVEHTDKNRLELNYIIVKIDLPTQRSLTPYLDKLDRYRIEIWRDIQNLKYKLADPSDPRLSQTLSNDKRIKLFEDYKALNEMLMQLVAENKIRSREQMILLLNKSSIETKEYKTYITVKLPKSKKSQKLRGSIYNEKFRSIRSITEISDERRVEIQEYLNRNTQELLEILNRKLREYTLKKAEYYRKRFIEKEPVYRGNISQEYGEDKNRSDSRNKEKSKSELFVYNSFNGYNNSNDIVDFSELHLKSLIYDGTKYDSTNSIVESIRRKRESQQVSLQRVRNKRESISTRIGENHKDLRREHEEYKERLPNSDFTFGGRIEEAIRECTDYNREREALLGAIKRTTDTTEKVTNEFREFKRKFERTIGEIRNKNELYEQRIREFKKLFIEKRNILIIDYSDIEEVIIDETITLNIDSFKARKYIEYLSLNDAESMFINKSEDETINIDFFEKSFKFDESFVELNNLNI